MEDMKDGGWFEERRMSLNRSIDGETWVNVCAGMCYFTSADELLCVFDR